MNFKPDVKTEKTALLVTIASILQMAESFLPQPIPGIKLGLANMITLVALVDLGFGAAVEIAVLRSLISSLLLGTFLSTSFILSFTSALASSVVMGAVYSILKNFKKPALSLIGISLLGAVAHNMTQLAVIYAFFIRSPGVLMLAPWLGISSVVTGWITGLVASGVCAKIALPGSANEKAMGFTGEKQAASAPWRGYINGKSFLHAADPSMKIIITAAAAAAIIFFSSRELFLAMLAAILITAMAAGISFKAIFTGVARMKWFLMFSFFMPLFFNHGGAVLYAAGPVSITETGLSMGAMFVFRMVLLMITADLMIKTTAPEGLLKSIEGFLRPFKFAGINGSRTSHIIVRSWAAVPLFWDRAAGLVKSFKNEKKRDLKSAIAYFTAVIAALYTSAEVSI